MKNALAASWARAAAPAAESPPVTDPERADEQYVARLLNLAHSSRDGRLLLLAFDYRLYGEIEALGRDEPVAKKL